MNRLGVLEVNNALMAFFERGNDLFDGTRMMIDSNPVRIEYIVREAIDSAFEGFIHNKLMRNARGYHCRLIDHRLHIGNTILAIETDEHAHQDRKEEDEQQRYRDFTSVFPYQFVFIRFNPHDNREEKDGKTSVEYKISFLKKKIRDQIQRIQQGKNIGKIEIYRLFY